jgi:hypothetical protein
MNWKLSFTKSGTNVNIYDKDGKIIFSRRLLGWQTRNYEDTVLVPKFQLNKGESISIDEDNVYINTVIKKD